MSVPEKELAGAGENPFRSSKEFYEYYAARHDSPAMVARFAALKHKILAFLALHPENPARTVLDMVSAGAANSRVFELRAPLMVKDRYDRPTMKISVWQKDMAVIGQFARQLRCPTPMFDATVPIYKKAMAGGHAEHDTAAVCAVLEKAAGVRRGQRKKAL